jgi:hypothetical protein
MVRLGGLSFLPCAMQLNYTFSLYAPLTVRAIWLIPHFVVVLLGYVKESRYACKITKRNMRQRVVLELS